MSISASITDIVELQSLIAHERQARDRNWWNKWRTYYAPDAIMEVAWFSGKASEYIDQSIQIAKAAYLPGYHFIGEPVIDVNGDRAVAEIPMKVEWRGRLRKVEIDQVTRYWQLNRFERVDGRWLIVESRSIFLNDTIEPTIPGTPFTLTPEDFAGMRPSYRALNIIVPEDKHRISRECYGVDRPDDVAALYQRFYDWAAIPIG